MYRHNESRAESLNASLRKMCIYRRTIKNLKSYQPVLVSLPQPPARHPWRALAAFTVTTPPQQFTSLVKQSIIPPRVISRIDSTIQINGNLVVQRLHQLTVERRRRRGVGEAGAVSLQPRGNKREKWGRLHFYRDKAHFYDHSFLNCRPI